MHFPERRRILLLASGVIVIIFIRRDAYAHYYIHRRDYFRRFRCLRALSRDA